MVYLLLGAIGALGSLSPVIAFLVAYPGNVGLFVQQAVGTAASLTAWLDVIIFAITVLVLVYLEGQRLAMKRLWIYGLGTLLVGPALGLPLFLYQRSRHLQLTANCSVPPAAQS